LGWTCENQRVRVESMTIKWMEDCQDTVAHLDTHTPTCTYMYIYIIKYMSRMCRYTNIINIRMYESSSGLERWTSMAFLNLEDGPNSKPGRILGFTKAIRAVTSCYQVWDAHVDESKSYCINEHIGQLWSVIVIAP
jgi:hypothetical protein